MLPSRKQDKSLNVSTFKKQILLRSARFLNFKKPDGKLLNLRTPKVFSAFILPSFAIVNKMLLGIGFARFIMKSIHFKSIKC